jgi:alkanesulfonate monooxygenase SsuD/methylene tetrahydromethanopterin reductase-like flavin-dependent oxidoreductase (luciferase family)
VMVGANGPRMLRLTAELADHWNGGLPSLDEVPGMLAEIDDICREVGRDPATLTRSVETLVRTIPAATGVPPEPNEVRGEPESIAAHLRHLGDLGVDHLQVQLRPRTVEGVEAFAPVIEHL